MNITLFGKRVFLDVTEDLELEITLAHPGRINAVTGIPVRGSQRES